MRGFPSTAFSGAIEKHPHLPYVSLNPNLCRHPHHAHLPVCVAEPKFVQALLPELKQLCQPQCAVGAWLSFQLVKVRTEGPVRRIGGSGVASRRVSAKGRLQAKTGADIWIDASTPEISNSVSQAPHAPEVCMKRPRLQGNRSKVCVGPDSRRRGQPAKHCPAAHLPKAAARLWAMGPPPSLWMAFCTAGTPCRCKCVRSDLGSYNRILDNNMMIAMRPFRFACVNNM
eukprot:881020-Pelagomonas_calceolata.AAC.12